MENTNIKSFNDEVVLKASLVRFANFRLYSEF